MIDVEKLLAPCVNNPPCGPDLEYDPDFTALEQASRGKPERVLGNHLTPAEPPNWVEIKQKAEALFARTKDLRVAALYTRGLTRLDNVEGLSDGLRLVHQLLVRYWDHVHPRLDTEDSNDLTMRLNALATIGDSDALLRDVRGAWIVNSAKYGKVAVRDLLIALGRFPAGSGEPVSGLNQLQGMIREATADNKGPLEAIRGSVQTLDELGTYLTEKVGAALAPDLRPLTDTLKPVLEACQPAASAAMPADQAPLPDRPVSDLPGQIRSREEAVRVLDQVCAFLERTEPANPAPLLIRRAQRLMTKNFVEIIQELAPDSLAQIQKIAGIKEE